MWLIEPGLWVLILDGCIVTASLQSVSADSSASSLSKDSNQSKPRYSFYSPLPIYLASTSASRHKQKNVRSDGFIGPPNVLNRLPFSS